MTEAARNIADREDFENLRQHIVDLQIIKRSEEPRDLVGTSFSWRRMRAILSQARRSIVTAAQRITDARRSAACATRP
jgi:hypothetical protein